ncbi:hypothetical protein [Nocardia wallacei]|uniref:hypothetical protein n=1 Tax=Nocardia wallacei TaxID=480035 RepID=UPI002457CEDE|nr:hypothetical protein [Nocardia wallacei]
MSAPKASEHVEDAAPARRTAGRITGGIVLILVATALLFVGIQAIVEPAAVVAKSSDTARSPDTDGEAQFGGLLLCFFGLSVLGFGIGLFGKK